MNEKMYCVGIDGSVREGFDRREVLEKLGKLLNKNPEVMERILSGNFVYVKKNVSFEKCARIKEMLHGAGAICRVEEVIPDGFEGEIKERQVVTQSVEKSVSPGMSPPIPPPMHASEAIFSMEPGDPRKVSAGSGWAWVVDGFSMFRESWVKWCCMGVVYSLLVMVCSIIPLLGSFAVQLLTPVLIAGMMHGARNQVDGSGVSVGDLFSGFTNSFGRLVLLGFLYLACFMVLAAAASGLFFASGLMPLMLGVPIDFGVKTIFVMILLIIIAAVSVPLSMGYWFSPLLISLYGMPVFKAFRTSLRGVRKNIFPFIVFGFVSLLLGGVLMAGISLTSFVAGNHGMAGVIPGVITFIIFLTFVPLWHLAFFSSCGDIFLKTVD